MMSARRQTLHAPLPVRRWVAVWIALVVLLGAMASPWGLTKSHGSTAFQHNSLLAADDSHGHSHEEETSAASSGHAHHTGDHAHDLAHALPVGLPTSCQSASLWHNSLTSSGPWPTLDGPERPPRS